jgi:hypothetical protein
MVAFIYNASVILSGAAWGPVIAKRSWGKRSEGPAFE